MARPEDWKSLCFAVQDCVRGLQSERDVVLQAQWWAALLVRSGRTLGMASQLGAPESPGEHRQDLRRCEAPVSHHFGRARHFALARAVPHCFYMNPQNVGHLLGCHKGRRRRAPRLWPRLAVVSRCICHHPATAFRTAATPISVRSVAFLHIENIGNADARAWLGAVRAAWFGPCERSHCAKAPPRWSFPVPWRDHPPTLTTQCRASG